MVDLDKKASAYRALEQAISELTQYVAEDCDGVLAVDAVLLVGMQWIDDEGDRAGGVYVFPRHGSQPPYITTGLLASASELVMQRALGGN